MSELLDAALVYANQGFAVLAWRYDEAGAKKPTTPGGFLLQNGAKRRTEAEVSRLWATGFGGNVGIITGLLSGIIVMDCDDQKSEDWWKANRPFTTWQVTSGRGRHFGYRYPEGFDGLTKRLKTNSHLGCAFKAPRAHTPAEHAAQCPHGGALCSLDIRGDGGFIAMPPSVHKSGRVYAWDTTAEDMDALLAGMPVFDPAWLPMPDKIVETVRDDNTDALDWDAWDTGGSFDAASAWIAGHPGAVSGSHGRNHTFSTAAELVRGFALSPRQALFLMEGAWNDRCDPSWNEAELVEKIEAAWAKGTGAIGHRVAEANMREAFRMAARQAAAPKQTKPAPLGENEDHDPEAGEPEPSPPIPLVAPKTRRAAPDGVVAPMTTDTVLIELPALVAMKGSVAYEEVHVTTVARVAVDRPDLYVELQQVLLPLLPDKVLWKKMIREKTKELRASAKPGRATSLAAGADGRKVIEVGHGDKETRDAIIAALKDCEGIYTFAERLAYVFGGKMRELRDGHMLNFIIDHCNLVKPVESGDLGMVLKQPAGMPTQILQMLQALLPHQLDEFRDVLAVVHSPFYTPDGRLVCTEGFDKDTGVLLLAPPQVDPELFGSSQEAIDYLWGIFREFHWANQGEFSNYLGALLAPIMRPMYEGAVPFIVVEANTQAAGKTLLCDCIHWTHGVEPAHTPMPIGEEELNKCLMGFLMQARSISMIDNVVTMMASPTLAVLATTSGWFEGRVLGSNEIRRCRVRWLLLISANNLSADKDASRRMQRVRLVVRGKRDVGRTSKTKKFEHENLQKYITQWRPQILSALLRLVHDWVQGGMQVPDSVPLIDTYEEFCKHVGAVLHYAGRKDWWANYEEARRSWSINDEWGPLLECWWKKYPKDGTVVSAKDLLEVALQNNLLLGLLSRGADTSAKQSILSKRLSTDLRDYDDGVYRVTVIEVDRAKAQYSLERLLDPNEEKKAP